MKGGGSTLSAELICAARYPWMIPVLKLYVGAKRERANPQKKSLVRGWLTERPRKLLAEEVT